MKKSLQFIAYFFKAYPKQSMIMVGWLVLSGFAEGLGIISLIPVLELFVKESAESQLGIANTVRDAITSLGLEPSLAVLLCGVVLLAVVKALFVWLAIRQVGYTIANVTTDLRLKLLAALMQARWIYYINQPSGHLNNALGFEAAKASGAYQHIVSLFAGAISVLIYLFVAIFVSWWIVLAALVIGFLFMYMARKLVQLNRSAGLRQVQVMKRLSAQLVDSLHGIKAIKAMNREQQLWSLLESETRELNLAQRQTVIANGSLEVMREPFIIGALSVGLFIVLTFTSQSFTAVLVLAFLFNRVMTRVTMLQKSYQSMVGGENAFWSLKKTIESADEHSERIVENSAIPQLRRELRFDNVSFKYAEKIVLQDVNITFPSGKVSVVVGPSGAGKTTLIDLILGLHSPTSGVVLVDGEPLEKINLHAWRSCIGYVPQEMFLFHESIYKNVTLGDTTISRQACESALSAAGAGDFVRGLPDGIESIVGERGGRLSGGQRQRIALARALVRQPNLLVLDEVTAGLDAATEEEICKTLIDLRGKVTIIAVSHQPALLSVADLVMEVRDGNVSLVEQPLPSTATDLV